MSNANKIVIGSFVVFILFNEYQKKRSVPPIYLRKKLTGNYNAKTIPPFGIFINENERENMELIHHELVHWQQYQEKGLLKFILNYQSEKKQFGYDKMPMEIAARANESEYCKRNYTECVRNGTAKTVFNPNFRGANQKSIV